MGSHSISFWRKKHPGMSDYQLAEKISSVAPEEAAIIVRYKHNTSEGEYDHFGSCGGPEKLRSYFYSDCCFDTEILYAHPLVPFDIIPPGLRIADDVPKESPVFNFKQFDEKRKKTEAERKKAEAKKRKAKAEANKKRKEKEKREKQRIAQIQSDRQASGQCIMCGSKLNFLMRKFGVKRHSKCVSFKE